MDKYLCPACKEDDILIVIEKTGELYEAVIKCMACGNIERRTEYSKAYREEIEKKKKERQKKLEEEGPLKVEWTIPAYPPGIYYSGSSYTTSGFTSGSLPPVLFYVTDKTNDAAGSTGPNVVGPRKKKRRGGRYYRQGVSL